MKEPNTNSKNKSNKSTCIILATLKVRECIFSEYLHHSFYEAKRRVKSWELNGFLLLTASIKIGDEEFKPVNSYAELNVIIEHEIESSSG